MPTIPKATATTLNNTADIVNAIRNGGSDQMRSYTQPVVPGNIDTLRAFGDALQTYQPLMNEFINAVNRISLVLITNKMYKNPLSMFKRGVLEYGETVEELFVEISRGYQYDIEESETTLFKRYKTDVRAAFHTLNYQVYYPKTVEPEELRLAFLSFEGVSDLIGRIVESMYTSAEYDEQNVTLYMIALQLLMGNISTLPLEQNLTDSVALTKEISNKITFMSTKYNEAGVHTFTNKEEQYILISAKYDAQIDVNVLASAFNMDKVQFMGQRVLIPSFGDIDMERVAFLLEGKPGYVPITAEQLAMLDNIPMILMSKDWPMIFDNMYKMTDAYNGKGLYWQYFYHVWKIFSHSPFAQAIAFVDGLGSVTDITVSPSSATLPANTNMGLTVKVTGEGFYSQKVTYSSDNPDVSVTGDGIVSVKPGASGTATITVTSVEDTTKTATAAITVA